MPIPFPLALSEVVFAGYGFSDSLRNDYKGLDVAGKIVLILSGFPPDYVQTQVNKGTFNAYAKQDAAQQHGAVAIFIIQEDFPRRAVPDEGPMYLHYFPCQVSARIFLYFRKNGPLHYGQRL